MSTLQRNPAATIHLGNVPLECDEDIIWELAVQFGPVQSVSMPRDRQTGEREDYAFVEFKSAIDAKYCADVLQRSPLDLYGRRIRVSHKGLDQSSQGGVGDDGTVRLWGSAEASTAPLFAEIGAKLAIHDLPLELDEIQLAEVFRKFGRFAAPPRMLRDPATGASRGTAYVSYDSFDASDAALAALNGRPLGGRRLLVEYAEKADGSGTRHGSAEERRMFALGGQTPAAAALQAGGVAPATAVDPTPMWARGLNPYHTSVAATYTT